MSSSANPVNSFCRLVAPACAALLVVATTAACREQRTSPATTGPEWQLVWRDEFDGAAGSFVDTTKWRPDTGDGCAAGICGWGNNEKEYYTTAAENVALDGRGHLTIVARVAQPGRRCYYGPCRYTSAKINTRGKFNAEPGKVEARIRLPAGQGLWPAFWMLGASFPDTPWPACGELDIMENHGSQPTTTSSAIHGPGYSGNTPLVHARTLTQGNFTDEFHLFGVIWDTARVQFLIDDTVHYTVTRRDVEKHGPWVFDQPFFLILNLAVGGNFDGDPKSDAILPATMVIDHVRVYTSRKSALRSPQPSAPTIHSAIRTIAAETRTAVNASR